MLNLIFCFQAYKKWLKTNDITSEEPLPGLEHLNHDQLFYLNFAQVWCGSTRPEALRSKLKTAVHAPGKYRYFHEFLGCARISLYLLLSCLSLPVMLFFIIICN